MLDRLYRIDGNHSLHCQVGLAITLKRTWAFATEDVNVAPGVQSAKPLAAKPAKKIPADAPRPAPRAALSPMPADRRAEIASRFARHQDMLEDLIAAAMNDAVRKAEALTQEKMSGFTSGMGLLAGFKLQF